MCLLQWLRVWPVFFRPLFFFSHGHVHGQFISDCVTRNVSTPAVTSCNNDSEYDCFCFGPRPKVSWLLQSKRHEGLLEFLDTQ
jgi:hypothetical protein